MFLEVVLILSLRPHLYTTLCLVCSVLRLDLVISRTFSVTTICSARLIFHDLTTLNISAMSKTYDPRASVSVATSISILLSLTDVLPFQLNIFHT